MKNINCINCHKHDFCKKYETNNSKNVDDKGVWKGCMSPIRKCIHAIVEKHYSSIHNKKVLEVGCGNYDKDGLSLDFLKTNGCEVISIDIKQTTKSNIICDVSDMPFVDDFFDIVIGNQTFEHWADPLKSLKEIYRVVKKDGLVYLNVPIHLHGSECFVRGDFALIQKMFDESGFSVIDIENYRKQTDDLKVYMPQKIYKILKEKNIEANTIYISNFILRK